MVDIRVVGAGGEYMESVVVVEWHKAVGDAVTAGELVVTVETAKAATEIEAAENGMLSEILAPVGAEVEVGAILGRIAVAGEDKTALPSLVSPAEAASATQANESEVEVLPAPLRPAPARGVGARVVASPLARRIAKQNGLDLAAVRASSPSGRVKRQDVEAALATRVAERPGGRPAASPPTPPSAAAAAIPSSVPAKAALAARASLALHLQRRSGDGIPIVLLHGFGAEGSSWRPLLSALRLRNPAIVIDLPSHGRSARSPAASVRALADEVGAALDADGVTEFHLVGHSLGGAVSLALCERACADIRSLCLLAPAGLGPEIDAGFVSGFARASHRESLEPWLRRLVADEALITPAFVSATMAARADPALREAQELLGSAMFPDGTQGEALRDALGAFLGPQRIVWGMRDRIIPWKHALGLSGRAGLHLLPEVGHMPQMEAPDRVAAILGEAVRSAE